MRLLFFYLFFLITGCNDSAVENEISNHINHNEVDRDDKSKNNHSISNNVNYDVELKNITKVNKDIADETDYMKNYKKHKSGFYQDIKTGEYVYIGHINGVPLVERIINKNPSKKDYFEYIKNRELSYSVTNKNIESIKWPVYSD